MMKLISMKTCRLQAKLFPTHYPLQNWRLFPGCGMLTSDWWRLTARAVDTVCHARPGWISRDVFRSTMHTTFSLMTVAQNSTISVATGGYSPMFPTPGCAGNVVNVQKAVPSTYLSLTGSGKYQKRWKAGWNLSCRYLKADSGAWIKSDGSDEWYPWTVIQDKRFIFLDRYSIRIIR